MFVVMAVMVTAAAFMVVVVVVAAIAFVVVIMVAAAAAFVIVVMVMAAAAFMIVVMVMATAAFVIMFMVRFMRRLVTMPVTGHDDNLMLHRPGDFCQLSDQCIRILRCQPQLLGGEGNDGLLHLGVGVELCLDLGSAVGAV